ncbi:hypothetical protein BVRB_3g057990 [Beta vulgaris subsp. vulgaris]|nr:hypothetical protein BVRB_3g057990 [Beta vulgaris subsp. vulgaris]
MYAQATEVSTEVRSIEMRLTPLLSRISTPEIRLTVGPGFPTTFNWELSTANTDDGEQPATANMGDREQPATASRTGTEACDGDGKRARPRAKI